MLFLFGTKAISILILGQIFALAFILQGSFLAGKGGGGGGVGGGVGATLRWCSIPPKERPVTRQFQPTGH